MKIILEAPSHRERDEHSQKRGQLIPVPNKSPSSNPHVEERGKIQEAVVEATATKGKLLQNIQLSKTASKTSRNSQIDEEKKVPSIQVKEGEKEVDAQLTLR